MKTMFRFLGFIAFVAILGLSVISCPPGDPGDPGDVAAPTDGGVIRDGVLFLTIGDRRDLNSLLPSNMQSQSVTWTTSDSNLVSVGSSTGIAEAVNIDTNASSTFISGFGTGTATITATAGSNTQTITVTATTEALTDIMSLPPLKTTLRNHFPLVGNIFNPVDTAANGSSVTNTQLTRHYNVLTHENDLKPSYLSNGRNTSTGVISYTWTTADRTVNAAHASGFSIVGHVLLWHSQNPNWVWSQIAGRTGTTIASRETALEIMKGYIDTVVRRYAGKIQYWDVLNEIFPDNASSSANWKDAMRRNASGEGQDANPWYIAIGSDFVYEGFLAARMADPAAILYYNDYNTDISNRARLIRDMVVEVNNRYLALPANQKPAGEPADRLLIEGIGMQEHHNLSVTAQRVRDTLTLFRNMTFNGSNRKIRISVSELDVLGNQTYNAFSSSTGTGTNKHSQSAVTNIQLITQAQRFNEYMGVYLEFTDIIERISLWGVTDNQSWRSGGLPLLFDHNGRAKPAYYRFVERFYQ